MFFRWVCARWGRASWKAVTVMHSGSATYLYRRNGSAYIHAHMCIPGQGKSEGGGISGYNTVLVTRR